MLGPRTPSPQATRKRSRTDLSSSFESPSQLLAPPKHRTRLQTKREEENLALTHEEEDELSNVLTDDDQNQNEHDQHDNTV